MILRWCVWGKKKETICELLEYSILSFKKQFGDGHTYIVFTDEYKDIPHEIKRIANVKEFTKSSMFNIDSVSTWKKWCPSPRLNIKETEIYVDADVFLLRHPYELYNFIYDNSKKFAVLPEYEPQRWHHGSMKIKSNSNTPFFNAGLFIQKRGADISTLLSEQLKWWQGNIDEKDRTPHDEQGALAHAISHLNYEEDVYTLPSDKYLVIGPYENAGIESLENVTLFHAVYPHHPAFYYLRNHLEEITYN
jgi:hypothetical protein